MIITKEDLKKLDKYQIFLIDEILNLHDAGKLTNSDLSSEVLDVKLIVNGKEVDPDLLNPILEKWDKAVKEAVEEKFNRKFYLLRKKITDFIDETLDELDFK